MARQRGEEAREGSTNRVAEKEKTEARLSGRRATTPPVLCGSDSRWRDGFEEEKEMQTATVSEDAWWEAFAVLWKRSCSWA